MSESHYVVRVIARLVTTRLIYRVLVAVSVIFISNYLIVNPVLADSFDLASSIVSIVMIASEVGMSMVLMKHTSERHYGTALTIETIAWMLIFVVILGGYALFNGLTVLFWLMAILGLNQAAIQYRVPIRSIFRSKHSHEKITYLEVLDGLSKLLGIVLITYLITDITLGAYIIAGWYTLTTIFFMVIYLLNSFHLVRPTLDWALAKPMIREGVWFAMQALIMTVYFEVDKWVLRVFQITGWANIADGDIARYGASSRIVVFFLVFHRIGLQVITPYLYAAYPDQLDKYRKIVSRSTEYMSSAGIIIGVLIITQADLIMHILYKPAFWNAIPALMLFGAFFIVRFIGITSSQIFATTENQPLRTKQEGVAVVGNVVLDLILMPWFSFLGGAIASFIIELFSQGIFFVISRRIIQAPLWASFKPVVPSIISGGLVGLTLWFSKPWWIGFSTTKPMTLITCVAVSSLGLLCYGALLTVWLRRLPIGAHYLLKQQ